MRALQLKTGAELLSVWPFICECCEATTLYAKEKVDPDVIFRVVSAVLARPTQGWAGVVSDGYGNNIGFGVVEDATPAYSLDRVFNVRFIYHSPGRHDATVALMRSFESWAKKLGIRYYTVTTQRTSGAAIRCIRSRQYGFRRAHLVFEKEIK